MGWNCSSNPLMLVDNVMLFAPIPEYHDFFGMGVQWHLYK